MSSGWGSRQSWLAKASWASQGFHSPGSSTAPSCPSTPSTGCSPKAKRTWYGMLDIQVNWGLTKQKRWMCFMYLLHLFGNAACSQMATYRADRDHDNWPVDFGVYFCHTLRLICVLDGFTIYLTRDLTCKGSLENTKGWRNPLCLRQKTAAENQ